MKTSFYKITIVTSLALLLLSLSAQAQWLTNYCFRKSITVQNGQVSGSSNLTNFPILISLSDNDLRTTANGGNVEDGNGDDIRITDNAHSELDIEIENYSATSGDLEIWVNVPTLDYDDDTELYIYYGNSSATAYATPEDVWDSNFAAVWHLNEDTGDQVLDATSNNMDEATNAGSPYSYTYTVNTNTTSIGGIISKGRSFNNVGNLASDDAYIEIPHVASNALDITGDMITIEAWARMYFPAPQDAPFVCKTTATNQESYMFGTQNGSNALNRRITGSEANTNNDGWHYGDNCATNGHYRYDDSYTADADWHYFVMVYDGSDDDGTDATNLKTFIDGSLQTFSRTGACDPYPYGDINSNTADVFLGRRQGTNRFFKGAMDEVRISNTARSDDWVITSYNNMSDPSSFYLVGSEEYPIEGGTATAVNSQVDSGEGTTINLTGYDMSASLQWQSSLDNSSFADMGGETGTSVSTGALTQRTYYRVKSTLSGCDAYSSVASVSVRAVFSSNYAYRAEISVDHTKVECSSNLTDFPLLINISGSSDLQQSSGKVQDANGYDIVFTDETNTMLSHDMEEYDGTNGDLVAWVEVPTLYCNANTVIYMYYGDCGYAGGDQSTTDTWSNNYNGIYHMVDDPNGGTLADRSGGTNTGTATNFASDTRLAGQIGQAIEFDGNNDYITFGTGPHVSGTGDRTYEAWIYTQTFGADEGIFQGGDPGNNDFSLHELNNSSENFTAETDGNDDDFTLVSTTNNWRHLAMTYNNTSSETSIYYDGELFDVISGALNTTSFAVELGRWNSNTSFDGYIDEFRISSVARSEDWIKTQFNNQSSPNTFYSIATEVSEFVWTGATDSDWTDPNNWSTCTVPSSTDDAIIPMGLSNYPVLTAAQAANYTNVASGASLDLNGQQLTVSGDFKIDGTFTANSGSVVLNGTGEQNIKGAGSIAYYDLEINKASGEALLNKDVSVTNTMTLTSGFIDLNDNTLTITSTGSISGGSASAFVITTSSSCLTQQDIGSGGRTGDITYPVGTISTSYTPATINNSTGTADDFCIYVCENVFDGGGCSGTQLTTEVVNKTWDISPATGTGLDVTVTLQWNGSDETGDYDHTNAYFSHYTGGDWNGSPGSDISAQGDPYFVSQSGITSFSSFGAGSGGSGLPVVLGDFQGSQTGNQVLLDWHTRSEINNDFFAIEHSINGTDFRPVGTVVGNGNSNEINEYRFVHNSPTLGQNFYRLRQTDYNGDFELSPIVQVLFSYKSALLIYPNPSNGSLYIEGAHFSEDAIVKIVDISGRVLLVKTIDRVSKSQELDISQLQPGQYILEVKTPNQQWVQKLIMD